MRKILIANRGEIALRIMRSAKEMGIATVAIYSEADRRSPHVIYADEAVCIGPPPSNQSYLLGDKIIDVCKKLKADAIHPGYGFLAENAEFARKVKDAGITFIGPTAEAMEIMGSKLAAKAAVKKYNIPMVPGTDKAITDVKQAKTEAKKIGFPILIKASAGGGGKGMRIVKSVEEFEEQMKLAVSEAESAFGDGSVFIERYIHSSKHIEFQVLADTHGNILHFFERECSIQRRHQKVIEEAPSAVLTPELREEMANCAVNVARSCNYVGAGTVEFLYENCPTPGPSPPAGGSESQRSKTPYYQKERQVRKVSLPPAGGECQGGASFYFLEMNTRLQVEHPVTELITGVDLVKEQIKIARGEKLSIAQEDLEINGHAIEARVYAEDPANNFLPDIGKLQIYQRPQGIGVRVDDGFEEGMEIPIYYDPMIAKLITYGSDRSEAVSRMLRAIDDYRIVGVETTLPFCKYVLQHKAFTSGTFDTHFVDKFFVAGTVDETHSAKHGGNGTDATDKQEKNKPKLSEQARGEAEVASMLAARLMYDRKQHTSLPSNSPAHHSKWKTNRITRGKDSSK